MDIYKYDGTYYTPRIYNSSSNTQLISFQTFATQVNQNKTALSVSLSTGGYVNVDQDDICFWSTSAAEVITTNVQVRIGNSSPYSYRWYEFKWWAMEIGTVKKIFMSITRNT
jgi:hypothetical protein